MPANSFQNAQTPDGKYAGPAGELHLLDEGDRNDGFDINVNPTTSWVEHDLSARVPKGTKAIYGHIKIQNTDASGILCIRDGSSTETDLTRTRSLWNGAGATTDLGIMGTIKATDGIFDIREHSATNEIVLFHFNLWGYFL